MKPGAGIATLLLGLALLPAGLPAGEEGEPAKPPTTRMHNQLNRLIRGEHGIKPLGVAPVVDEPQVAAGETLQLEPMIVEEEKLKNLPPPETKAEKFFRTGTIWKKVGRTFTKEFWFRSGRGIGFTLSW